MKCFATTGAVPRKSWHIVDVCVKCAALMTHGCSCKGMPPCREVACPDRISSMMHWCSRTAKHAQLYGYYMPQSCSVSPGFTSLLRGSGAWRSGHRLKCFATTGSVPRHPKHIGSPVCVKFVASLMKHGCSRNGTPPCREEARNGVNPRKSWHHVVSSVLP